MRPRDPKSFHPCETFTISPSGRRIAVSSIGSPQDETNQLVVTTAAGPAALDGHEAQRPLSDGPVRHADDGAPVSPAAPDDRVLAFAFSPAAGEGALRELAVGAVAELPAPARSDRPDRWPG